MQIIYRRHRPSYSSFYEYIELGFWETFTPVVLHVAKVIVQDRTYHNNV